jgi:DNA polymerase-4
MILHIDMDAFYASVEQLDNPQLKGKPVIVGGDSNRGVVSAASYEAREYGIRSAMPIFRAKQKCPDGIFIPPRMSRYKEVSKQIMALLTDFSPLVEVVSIDEAYVDIAGCLRLHGEIAKIATRIKKRVKETVNLSCSVGIAPNKMLAKIASDMDKPDGLTIITPEKAPQFIETLPIHKVPGVGKITGQKLTRLGIQTLGDIKNYPEQTLVNRLGKFGRRLIALSVGINKSSVNPSTEHKSVSTETTLAEDTNDIRQLKKYLLGQSQAVGRDLRKSDVKARTITLKIKHSDFKQITRNMTLQKPTQAAETIYQAAVKLLSAYRITGKIRLIGIGASSLVPDTTPIQMDLFNSGKKSDRNWEKVDKTLDTIVQKYGKDAVKRAALYEK